MIGSVKASENSEGFAASRKKADAELSQLGSALDNGSIRNAVLLKEYGALLKKQQPELSNVVDVITLDASRQGALYSGLLQRLKETKSTYLIPPYEDTLHSIDLLREAAKDRKSVV